MRTIENMITTDFRLHKLPYSIRNRGKNLSKLSPFFSSDKNFLMARWFCLYLIVFIFFFNNIKMMILTDDHDLLKRHIGSAQENRYRAKQRASNNIQQQQQSFLSPDLLRARWIELYNEQNKKNKI